MRMMRNLFGLAVVLIALAVGANAQTVVFNGIGSSALFLELGQGAHSTATGAPGAACVWSNNTGVFQATDPTTGQPESGNFWVAWTTGGGHGTCSSPASGYVIYAYLQTDSTVGDRCLFNGCTIGTTSTSPTTLATNNLILPTGEQTNLPSVVWTALDGLAVSVAGTDIRPEDAAFATLRATKPCGTPVVSGSQYLGLGYNQTTPAYHLPIESAYSSSSFNVTPFTLPSSFTVTRLGAVPIVVFANPGNATGFGSLTNLTRTQLAHFLDGSYGKTSDVGTSGSFPTTVLIREPLSGTYNTMEYAVPNTTTNSLNTGLNLETSQDVGKNQLTTPIVEENCNGTIPRTNPLNIESEDESGAYRNRVIGTGQMVSTVLNLPNPISPLPAQTTDTLGYAFWSTANFANATSTFNSTLHEWIPGNAKYIQIDGVDPLLDNYTTSNGALPTSGNSLLGDVTFNNLKNGDYPIWSFLRLVNLSTASTDTTDAVAALNAAAQTFVSGPTATEPDFVPISSINILRSHFMPPGITTTPSNGTSGCTSEAGGDVGGVIINAGDCTTGLRM